MDSAQETNKEPRTVCLAYSTTKQVRQTYLAGEWAEPRSLVQRYAPALAGLDCTKRRRILAQLAVSRTN